MNILGNEGGYPNLFRYGTKPGVYRSPAGYQHPWLAVTPYGTAGAWSRAEARVLYREAKRKAWLYEYLSTQAERKVKTNGR